MNQLECRQIAEERLLAAEALLAAGRWPSAYYLAGYAVECGLKSCIFARVAREGVLFDDIQFQKNCWTHDLVGLVRLAGLEATRQVDIAANPTFGQNWLVVEEWDEQSRYRLPTQIQAEKLYEATADSVNGVMQWIRARW